MLTDYLAPILIGITPVLVYVVPRLIVDGSALLSLHWHHGLTSGAVLMVTKCLRVGGPSCMMAPEMLQATPPVDGLTFHKLLDGSEFWSALAGALAGAIAAFALGALAQWRGRVNARRSAGNLAIIALAEMYSEAKAISDAIFGQIPALTQTLGRPPHAYEFSAAMDAKTVPPPFDIEQLGFLADSHDPDILLRLIVAKNDFGAMLKIVANHERLQLELQRRMGIVSAKIRPPPSTDDVPELAGMDVIVQLEATVNGLQSILPDLIDALKRVGDELRDVLLYQLPWGSFLRFVPQDRGRLSEAKLHAVKPARWRRLIRGVRRLVDNIVGPRWPS